VKVSRRTLPVGLFFGSAGLLHFVRPKMYEAIMPPYVPNHREMVYASGVAEIAGGAAAVVPSTRTYGRWGLIATLVGVFPANLHMALNPQDYKKIPAPLLWGRLPLQAAAIAWVYWATAETA
jgi:uncharacterized membrane protein